MKTIYRFFLSQPLYLVVIYFFLLALLLPNSLGNILELLFSTLEAPNPHIFDSEIKEFFSLLVLAPVLETIIFQMLVYSFLRYILKFRTITILILSAIIFGISHCYDIVYVIVAAVMGFLFMFLYIILNKREFYPLLITILTHSMLNLITFIYYKSV